MVVAGQHFAYAAAEEYSVFVVRVVVRVAAVATNFVHVASEVVAVGVVCILDRDPENHHAFVGFADAEAAEARNSLFVVQNLQVVPHGQMFVVLDLEDNVLLGIVFDSVPLGGNCLLDHLIVRQAPHDSVAMASAEVFENDYFENRCLTLT